jgi:hypothetical protein
VATQTASASTRKIEVTGTITALSATSITVQPTTGAPLTCSIPATKKVTGFAAGNRVEMRCRASGTTFVLQRLRLEDRDDEADEAEVDGRITALSSSSITVQPRTGASVTCTIPAAKTLSGFATGDQVEMECRRSGTALVLQRLKHEDGEDDDDDRGDHRGRGRGGDDRGEGHGGHGRH